MDSVAYLRGILRSWWLVLIVVIAGGLGGFLVYERATPQYSTAVQIIVASKTPDADEASARALSSLRATTIASVAPTGPVLEAAALEAGRTGQTDGVAVTATSSESFLTVTVTGPTPEVIRDVAAAFPTVLPAEVDELAGATGTRFDLNTVTPPALPAEPFDPVLSKDVGLGLAAGLVLGLALAVLRETLNRSVRDSDELRRITGLPILGIVPRDLPRELLPAASHPRSARAEAYRQVRTALLNASDRRPLTVAVTSATSGEGKTSVSTNLAVVLSRAGHRVALIDADLRRPRVADYLGIAARPGLTEVLTGEVALDDALVLQDDGRLAVLPAGSIPPHPSEALGSPAMREVLGGLAKRFEFVVIDTPPVLPVTDALVLGPAVDGMVLVARLGYTTRDRLERARAGVDRVNATLFGVVPNQAGKGSDSDYSYTYRGDGARAGDRAEPRVDEPGPG